MKIYLVFEYTIGFPRLIGAYADFNTAGEAASTNADSRYIVETDLL